MATNPEPKGRTIPPPESMQEIREQYYERFLEAVDNSKPVCSVIETLATKPSDQIMALFISAFAIARAASGSTQTATQIFNLYASIVLKEVGDYNG